MVRKSNLLESARAACRWPMAAIMGSPDAESPGSFRFLLIAVAGWMNQHQLLAIDYLREENRIFREQLARRRIRPRTSSGIAGRPPLGRDRQPPYRRNRRGASRDGFRLHDHEEVGPPRPETAQRSSEQPIRSKECNGGRGRLRFSTAPGWRKASTSSAVSLRVLKKTLTAAKRDKTNSITIHLGSMGKLHAGRARRSKAEVVDLHSHRVCLPRIGNTLSSPAATRSERPLVETPELDARNLQNLTHHILPRILDHRTLINPALLGMPLITINAG